MNTDELNLQAAIRVIAAMRDGAILHREFVRGGSSWRLSTGRKITAPVAELVLQSASIVAEPDSLFTDGPAQTYRWWRS